MDRLARTAQVTIATALMNHYGFRNAQSETEKNSIATRGAAAANFLNGETSSPMHASLDLAQIDTEARQWMRQNQTMKELVVQTLRVKNVVATYAAQQRREAMGEVAGMAILEEFGKEVPESPSTDTYEALLRRVISTLPPDNQQQMLNFMQTRR